MTDSFYSQEELRSLGFGRIGTGCLISRNARFYSPERMSIGDYVRIDDFCILSGNITLGSHIHIAAYSALYGALGIVMEDDTGISARTTVYSAMDDFSGDYLVGPVHPSGTTHVTGGTVTVRKYAQVGAHCVVFPALEIGEGTVVGACSLVRRSLDEWGVYFGTPAIRHADRRKGLLKYCDND